MSVNDPSAMILLDVYTKTYSVRTSSRFRTLTDITDLQAGEGGKRVARKALKLRGLTVTHEALLRVPIKSSDLFSVFLLLFSYCFTI